MANLMTSSSCSKSVAFLPIPTIYSWETMLTGEKTVCKHFYFYLLLKFDIKIELLFYVEIMNPDSLPKFTVSMMNVSENMAH